MGAGGIATDPSMGVVAAGRDCSGTDFSRRGEVIEARWTCSGRGGLIATGGGTAARARWNYHRLRLPDACCRRAGSSAILKVPRHVTTHARADQHEADCEVLVKPD